MPTFSKDKLEDICYRIFKAAGGTDDHSKTTGDHLVAANLAGHDSHGFVQIPNYIQQIDTASLDPTAEPTIHNETSTTAQVDGGWNFGQLAADDAIKLCIKKAVKNNIACVTLKNAIHVGRLSDYTSQAAKKNLIGMAFANLHGTGHIVSAFGGIDRKLPSNPISISTPGNNKKILFEMDMSTCATSEGKLNISYLIKKKDQ